MGHVLFVGNIITDLNFQFTNNANAFGGCGTIFEGEFWYFGGKYYNPSAEGEHKNQVTYFDQSESRIDW